jgi:PAS domain S-box-containing protein
MKNSTRPGSLPRQRKIEMTADRRVLIVDDDVDFADSLRDLLEAESYRVEVAHNDRDAVAAAEAFAPQVALLDIRLQFGPDNGLDLLSTLRQKYPDLLDIVMTAYADTDTAIKALQSDAYDYLRKPLYSQELITTLNRCFEKIDLEQKNQQAMAALRTSEERYRSIFENALEGIFRSTPAKSFIDVNPALIQMLGYNSKEEVLALNPKNLYADSEELQYVTDQYRSKKAIRNLETTWKKKNGESIIVSLNCQIVLDAQGQVLFYEGMVQDITERKRAEEALKEYSERLEEMVKERTKELQNALQKAQMADQLKSEFVANINHELRTPLTNLVLYHQMLRTHPSVKTDERLDVVGRELQRLRTLIEELLNLSRLDLGQVTFHPIPHNLNKLIRTLVNDRRALAEERGLTFTTELHPTLPSVWLDEAMIAQAVSNLLTNAMNYTPPGGRVEIRTKVMDDPSGKLWVVISVQDTGPGINEADLPRIFERFYRGKAGHESGAPGTGLGLAIVKQVVEKHHGRIEVGNGADGHGAVISVWLPVENEREAG